MSAPLIQCRDEQGVQIIELNRPAKKNAFTGAMYLQLSHILQEADDDSSVAVILITGAGDAFSAGNDMEDFLNSPPENAEAPPFHFLKTLAKIRKPVVAAVNGMAVGIGATMLLHCDLVFAQHHAKFSFPFVSLGLVPEGASSLLLPKLVGHQRAAEILWFGSALLANEAQSMGFVNQVVTERPVLDLALEQALRLARLPTGSVVQTKALLKPMDAILRQIDAEANAFVARTQSSAAQEAFAAFFEKRKPNFSGLD